MIQLVLGGARSGKSSYAESQADKLSDQVIYIATAGADDVEMKQRIANHQSSRPSHWRLIEEKFLLSEVLKNLIDCWEPNKQVSRPVILIDCLTLWLSNWLCRFQDEQGELNEWEREKANFMEQLQRLPVPILLVSNEVGSGIVPMGELSRQFVDQAGWLNQAIAKVSERVVLVAAGLPLMLKDSGKKAPTENGSNPC
jgi:adenosylcobinamide kinase / adenosylcobinamide-phosphate guanylyltransferase